MSEAFHQAWALLKMPFDSGRGLTAETLYQGRRRGDKDTGFWTPHKDKAVAYALFGSRYDFDDDPFVDPSKHIPEVYRVDAPKENVRLPLDMEYVGLGDASGAVERRRVAFEDKKGIIPSFNPVKLDDKELVRIIERLLREKNRDDNFLEGGEIPKSRFERIFEMENTPSSLQNWEGMYVDDDSRNRELMEAFEVVYDDDPDGYIDWDSLATTMGDVAWGYSLKDFIQPLGGPSPWVWRGKK